MPRLNYLAPIDAIHYYQKYRSMIEDMSRSQMHMILILLLNGEDIDSAFDIVVGSKKIL